MRDDILRIAFISTFALQAAFNLAAYFSIEDLQSQVDAQGGQVELSGEYTYCNAEGFTSDHTGVVDGYVVLGFYGQEGPPAIIRLHESRAEELINWLTKARADVAKLMEEK